MTKLSDWAAEYASIGVVRITKSSDVTPPPQVEVHVVDPGTTRGTVIYVAHIAPPAEVEVHVVDPVDDPEDWYVALLAFGALGYNARVSAVAVDRSGAVYACSAPADRVHSR